MSKLEYFDIVDYDDKPTGKLTHKKEAHDKGMLHRIVCVLVFTPQGKLLVQKHKQMGRGLDHSVGGHVVAGESYKQAAKRELFEELGLKAKPELIDIIRYAKQHYENHDPFIRHNYGVFTAKTTNDWKFIPNDEVDQIVEMAVYEIVNMMNRKPDIFLKGFLTSLAAYLKVNGSKQKIIAYGKDWSVL